MFQFVHLLFFVTLCHCQDLDAIVAQFNEVATEATGITQPQAIDYGVTEAISHEATQTIDNGVTETIDNGITEAAPVESEAEGSRRKRQDDAPVEAPATETDGDFGDLDSLLAHISEATQATELPSEIATELPSEIATELPSEIATELPSEIATELPSEIATEPLPAPETRRK